MSEPNVEAAVADAMTFLRGYVGASSLREVAIRHAAHVIRSGIVLPEDERDLTADFLLYVLEPQKRGRKVNAPVTRVRNWMIAYTVSRVSIKFGLPPTRNPATEESESACSIVAAASQRLHCNLSEAAVNKIWQTREAECAEDFQFKFAPLKDDLTFVAVGKK